MFPLAQAGIPHVSWEKIGFLSTANWRIPGEQRRRTVMSHPRLFLCSALCIGIHWHLFKTSIRSITGAWQKCCFLLSLPKPFTHQLISLNYSCYYLTPLFSVLMSGFLLGFLCYTLSYPCVYCWLCPPLCCLHAVCWTCHRRRYHLPSHRAVRFPPLISSMCYLTTTTFTFSSFLSLF